MLLTRGLSRLGGRGAQCCEAEDLGGSHVPGDERRRDEDEIPVTIRNITLIAKST